MLSDAVFAGYAKALMAPRAALAEQVFCTNMRKTPIDAKTPLGVVVCAACKFLIYKGKMVGRAGFEPATNWLKANCSTN